MEKAVENLKEDNRQSLMLSLIERLDEMSGFATLLWRDNSLSEGDLRSLFYLSSDVQTLLEELHTSRTTPESGETSASLNA